MIRELTNTDFPHLKLLSLKKNHIYSVDSLYKIYAPELRQLYLGSPSPNTDDNHLTDIRSLRKAYFPDIATISLGMDLITAGLNLIHTRDCINQVYGPSLTEINLRIAPDKSSHRTNSWLFKL